MNADGDQREEQGQSFADQLEWLPMDADELQPGSEAKDELTEQVISAAFEVSNRLGTGFLEKVYERALVHELVLRGIRAEAQRLIRVFYKNLCVGDYYADILVEEQLVLELKCVNAIAKEHVAQCLNYLRATGHRRALILNFQRPRLELKRLVNKYAR